MEIVATYLGHMIKHKLLTHEEHTESNYLKPMKTLNFKTSELYYYFNTTNTSSFVDLNETFLANMKLYHSDLLNDLEYTSDLYHINEDGSFTINNDKKISTLSLEKLKALYKSKYEEFQKDEIEKPFMSNLFTHYNHSFKSLVEKNIEEILKMRKNIQKTNDNLNQISYEQHKRSGVDYYDISKKYNTLLQGHMNKNVDSLINTRRNVEKINLASLTKDILIDLCQTTTRRLTDIQDNLEYILNFNNKLIKTQERHSDQVDSYNALVNSTYLSKEVPYENIKQLQRFLQTHYGQNSLMINVMLNVHHRLSKEEVLKICDEIGVITDTALSSYMSHHKSDGVLIRMGHAYADLITNIRFKRSFKQDVIKNDIGKLIADLEEYETFAISKFQSQNIIKLYLYALTHLFSDKMYQDFLTSQII